MLIKILNGFDDVIISGNEDTIENKSGTIRIIIYSDPSHFINKHVLDSNEKIDNDQSFVLCDYNMGEDINGFDVYDKLRSVVNYPPHRFITVSADETIMYPKGTGYIRKPYNRRVLKNFLIEHNIVR